MSEQAKACAASTPCATCGNGAASKRCACGAVWYCGEECQRMNWGDHKGSCTVVLYKRFEGGKLGFDDLLRLGKLLQSRNEYSRSALPLVAALRCAKQGDLAKCIGIFDMLMKHMYESGKYEELIEVVKDMMPGARSVYGDGSDSVGRLLGAWGACEKRLGRNLKENKDYQEALQAYKVQHPSLSLNTTEQALQLAIELCSFDEAETLMRDPGFEALGRGDRNYWRTMVAQRYLWSCSRKNDGPLGDTEVKRRAQRSLEILQSVRADFRQMKVQRGALLGRTLYTLGYAYWMSGDTGRAMKRFEKALQLFAGEDNLPMVKQARAAIEKVMSEDLPEFATMD